MEKRLEEIMIIILDKYGLSLSLESFTNLIDYDKLLGTEEEFQEYKSTMLGSVL
jgi:hypothetical protein